MKQLEHKDAPGVGGGYTPAPEGGFPELGYPQWPLAPDPFPEFEPHPMPSDPDAR